MAQIKKSESFMRGAFVLTIAALVTRLMGVFYKPVVARLFAPFDGKNGAAGVGLTQVPLSIYMVILSFTSVGLNVGISRLMAERLALGDVRGARRVFRLSLTFSAVLGGVCAVGLYVAAPWVARAVSAEAAATIPGFRATAPALLVVSIMAAYRGMFQGFQRMVPNAFSQIIEQLVRVLSGLVLTYLLVRRSVPLGAAGFNLGDVLGAGAALLYLLFLVRRYGNGLWVGNSEEAVAGEPLALPEAEPAWTVIRRIFAVAGPIMIIGAVVPLMMSADTFLVYRSLADRGVHGLDADAQYGMLTNAFMIVNLPTILTQAIYTSILPAITEAVTLGRKDEALGKARLAYRVTTLVGIPAQIGLYALATGIYAIIYGDVAGGPILAAMSWSAAATMLQQTTSGVLQGMGHVVTPMRNFVLGALVKIALTAYFTKLWGINGAAYATGLAFGIAAILNLWYVERRLGRTLDLLGMLIKPMIAALAMQAAILPTHRLLMRVFPHPSTVTFLLVALGALVYGLVILIVKGVDRQEVELVPKIGRPLAAVLARTHLLRD